jgi:hypothetical protein
VKGTRAWRLRRRIWLVRRRFPQLVAQPLSLVSQAPVPERPIFVIGCPRSGTSVLLQALLRSPELRSIQSEGHILWDAHHHPRDRGWDSDALGAHDVGERERRYIHTAIQLFVRDRTFVDKTPENSLRIPYLNELFADARYVFLRRRAADNVNSLIEGWRARPRFVKYRLPEPLEWIEPLDGRFWSFVLVPGWRELRHAQLEEICAAQYVACNETVLEARAGIDEERWVDLSYEELVASPVEELRALFARLELDFVHEAERFAADLPRASGPTALTPARPDKWREQNAREIERILPVVAKTELKLGY